MVGVMEYEWGGDAQALLMRNATSPGSHETIVGSAHEIKGYDFVICSDCVYAKSSVKPLLASLRQVSENFLPTAKYRWSMESSHRRNPSRSIMSGTRSEAC